MENKNIILTGDRPTGRLHLGHYVGSLKRRVELQNSGNYDEINILIADDQALTDNADNPGKIRENIINVVIDYLSVGIDPTKSTICVQSALPALHALTFYYMNLVTTARLSRNPTVKAEIQLRGFADEGLPAGFFAYPVSQAADITAFDANVVPVGEDQLPMLEQAREIVEKFNRVYGETLVMPKAMIPENETQRRLPGVDGKAKMSKSLGNCIYLSDTASVIKKQVNGKMYTDPLHLQITDPGHTEGNVVFTYLDALCTDEHFAEYLPDYANLEEMKEHYRRGGLGDGTCKKFLLNVLEETLSPIRAERAKWEKDIDSVYDIITDGTARAVEKTNATLARVRKAMRIDYFNDRSIVKEWEELLKKAKQ
ncbi:MAG: tryptophan--tRNA ligase [Oscillospiraceae bacterium]|nr:tryptophan--tRNA ligase [Oscillospiraceae bacterium]MDD7278885.1 tryptophan--tRNA ligase [Oscillospiraceae bacterium]MDY2863928.1 tryptophan--tRNA ligase [Oscillospiraceae bacterium]